LPGCARTVKSGSRIPERIGARIAVLLTLIVTLQQAIEEGVVLLIVSWIKILEIFLYHETLFPTIVLLKI
jgi:hypothetical protein